jgi:5'-nucleotidase
MAMGVPGIALSQAGGPQRDPFFEPAVVFAPGIVRKLVATGWPSDVVININFPNRPPGEIAEVEVTRQGFRDVQIRHAEKRVDLRGREYYWMGYRQTPSQPADGTDLRAIYDGRISVTPLHIDLTHIATVRDLRAVLGGVPPKL